MWILWQQLYATEIYLDKCSEFTNHLDSETLLNVLASYSALINADVK